MGDRARFLVKVPHLGACKILGTDKLEPAPLLIGHQGQRLLHIGTNHTGVDIRLIAGFIAGRDDWNVSAGMARACWSIPAWRAVSGLGQWAGCQADAAREGIERDGVDDGH